MSRNQKEQRTPTAYIVLNILFFVGLIGGFAWYIVWTFNTVEQESEQRSAQRYEQEQSIVQVDTKSGNAPRERLVTLKDGRKVLCLAWEGAVSCDWGNAK